MARTPKTLDPAVAQKIVNMQGLAIYDAQVKDWVDAQIAALPEEQFLDSTATDFVPEFGFDAADYPEGTVDPNLNGKPVLILGLKTYDDNDTTKPILSVKFVDMSTLADVYDADNSKNKAVDITVDDYKISAELKLHVADKTTDPTNPEADNIAVIAADGSLYVPKQAEFDAGDIENRLDDLENIVGHDDIEANGADPAKPAVGLVKDIKDLKATVGDENSGLVKDMADAQSDIVDLDTILNGDPDDNDDNGLVGVVGKPEKPESSEGAGDGEESTGLFKYVDDKVGTVSGSLNYADSDDISSLFAL